MKPLALAIALAAILVAPAALAAALLVLAPSAGATAAERLLERGFEFGHGMREMEMEQAAKLIRAAVEMVRASGYRCDSVSYIGLRSLFWSGIALSCNRLRYSYRLEDVGGRWVIEVR